ncbi:MAG: PD-(D/E)XK nuclease-like domain-containing protein [Planctomycetota bacterium]
MNAPIDRVSSMMVMRMAEHCYHSLPQVSWAQLVDFLDSPQLYYKRHVLNDPAWRVKPNDVADFRNSCHEAILVHKDATKGYCIIPNKVLSASGARAGKAWKEWEAQNRGVAHFKSYEVAPWNAMWRSIQECGPANDLLLAEHPGSLEERTILWDCNGVGLRCRIDRVIPGRAIVDLKTCANADLNAIGREIETRKLFIQAAFCQQGWQEAADEKLDFIFVFVEKYAPFRTVCVTIDAAWLEVGMEKFHTGLQRLQACFNADDFSDPICKTVHKLAQPTAANLKSELVEEK